MVFANDRLLHDAPPCELARHALANWRAQDQFVSVDHDIVANLQLGDGTAVYP